MIIDSSAVLAIAFQEAEAERFASAIATAPARSMSSVNWFEALMVAESRFGIKMAETVMAILNNFAVDQIAFDNNHALEAQQAWRRYGKGRHPAALNMADCCAYATAIIRNEPLLYKGEDFAKTDIVAAPW